MQKLGTISLAYGFGLLLGSIGLFPEGSSQYKLTLQGRPALPEIEIENLISNGTLPEEDRFVNQISSLQDIIPTVVVPLAFPLLLFSLNIRRWLKYAKKGFVSVVLALVSGLVMVTAGFFILERHNTRKLETCRNV